MDSFVSGNSRILPILRFNQPYALSWWGRSPALLAKECIQQCSVSLVLSCQNLLINPLCSPGNNLFYKTLLMWLRSDTSRFREEMRICIILTLPISNSTNLIWDWLWREAFHSRDVELFDSWNLRLGLVYYVIRPLFKHQNKSYRRDKKAVLLTAPNPLLHKGHQPTPD